MVNNQTYTLDGGIWLAGLVFSNTPAITFSEVELEDKVTIASNGISIMSADGGACQILNDSEDGDMFVRILGVPTKNQSNYRGQIYSHREGANSPTYLCLSTT